MALAGTAAADTLQAVRYGDFDHYTFALTWQPGFYDDRIRSVGKLLR